MASDQQPAETALREPGVRAIAFYLPQYHPIPENDQWWGNGFTEWRNVARARPRFPGHYQPHLPADLGFYDLRVPEVRQLQADMAREHGVAGFCYYHYWFNGRRILERPFDEVLRSRRPDFPFCLCWANENWTRAWDGGEKEILLGQVYSDEDDRNHIRALIPALADDRYIRVNGKAVVLIYRTELLPCPERTAQAWRNEARSHGIGELHLLRVEGFRSDVDPASIGFDGAVEFAPDWRRLEDSYLRTRLPRKLAKWGVIPDVFMENAVSSYAGMVERMLAKERPRFRRYRCVTPGFDNSARRKSNAAILLGTTPSAYQEWLEKVVSAELRDSVGDDRIVFINAWNEWGEGNHLEPDVRFGMAYLEATRRALSLRLATIAGSRRHETPGHDRSEPPVPTDARFSSRLGEMIEISKCAAYKAAARVLDSLG